MITLVEASLEAPLEPWERENLKQTLGHRNTLIEIGDEHLTRDEVLRRGRQDLEAAIETYERQIVSSETTRRLRARYLNLTRETLTGAALQTTR